MQGLRFSARVKRRHNEGEKYAKLTAWHTCYREKEDRQSSLKALTFFTEIRILVAETETEAEKQRRALVLLRLSLKIKGRSNGKKEKSSFVEWFKVF